MDAVLYCILTTAYIWGMICILFLGNRLQNCSPYAIGLLSCLSVLSVTLVYCGQTVGQIKMKLGMQVGLGPGHIVLGEDLAHPPRKGYSPPIFGPYLLQPNGCMDQDATWFGARPRPRRLCVRWGPRCPSQKRGRSPQIFGPCFFVAKQLDGSKWYLA